MMGRRTVVARSSHGSRLMSAANEGAEPDVPDSGGGILPFCTIWNWMETCMAGWQRERA